MLGNKRIIHLFTLVEIIVILGVLAVLASILLPILSRSIQEAREHQCMDNLRRLGVAAATYADQYDGHFPYTYGPLETDADPAWQAQSRASMQEFLDYVGDRANLYCPTFWHHSNPQHHGMIQERYTPGGSLTWGYNKWVGTLNTKPLTAHSMLYTRYQDAGQSVSHLGPGLRRPGYLSFQRLDKALRYYTVTGNSINGELQFQSAFRPNAVKSLLGRTPIPISELVLFADSNNIGETGVSASHSQVEQSHDNPQVPPAVDGINELLADGHVRWFGIYSTSLYYITDGDPGGAGVFVQDNR